MSALLGGAWAALLFSWLWRGRPTSWDGRPELGESLGGAERRVGVLGRCGAALQRRLPVLAELSSVAVGTAVATGTVMLILDPKLALIIAVATAVVAMARRIGRERALREALVRQTPAALDLLQLCLSAGLTPRLAFAEIAGLVPDPLGAELAAVARRAERGESLATALGRVAAPGHPLRPMALGVASAEASGQALAPLVERQARAARDALRRHAEARARRLPVTLLVPLVTCVLPAFILIVIVPMVAARFAHLF